MRLIDADELKAKWYEINDIDENDRGARFVGYTEIARLIDQTPTIEPSGDLISREWLLDLYDIDTTNFKETAKVPLEVVIQNIKDAPSVSIQPKTIVNNCDRISRAEAIEVVGNLMADDEIEMYAYYIIEKALNELPSADRPKGEWIKNDALGWKCSRCGIITNLNTHYCPSCGADMRKDQDR